MEPRATAVNRLLFREEPAPPDGTAAPSPGLLDAALDLSPARSAASANALDAFLREPSPGRALAQWVGSRTPLSGPNLKHRLAQLLARDVAHIDGVLNRQVNAVLHHPAFQKLEASWRGLRYLVEQVPEGENIKVRMLSATWKELGRDLERAIEFDQSQLFRKIYNDEFGMPGGEPFGVLLGDYEIHHKPSAEHPMDDLAVLGGVANVAAAAFAPFVAGVHPSVLDLTSFSELELPLDLPKTFEQLEYIKWKSFREADDSRFVGLTAPRVLLRLPYADDGSRPEGFRFQEDVRDPTRAKYLWGNACWAFGAVLVRAFAESGWLAAIRGARRGEESGGLVTGLPAASFGTSRAGVSPKSSTDVMITDDREKELGDLGFVPLCHCPDTAEAAFYGNQSVQKPKVYDEAPATANARLSAMLQYVLCASRFAHYLKVIARDRIGSFQTPDDLQDYLRRWVGQYVTSNDNAGPEVKARYPLREARVQVREKPGKPGTFMCVMHLRPHFQLDQLHSAVKLVTELAPPQGG